MRRSPKVAEVLPILYLRGLSTGDFRPALEGLLAMFHLLKKLALRGINIPLELRYALHDLRQRFLTLQVPSIKVHRSPR